MSAPRRPYPARPLITLFAMIIAACPSLSRAQVRLSDATGGLAADPIPHHQDRPPNPPRSPGEAARAMTVPSGFHVEVVASEPDIVNPVAMTFDERGRVWITESLEYPRRSPGLGRDRVKILEDSDGDGKADKFVVFAEGLNIPSGIAVGHGGVWVANSPDILYLRDTDGDGKADQREVVATGFGRSDTHELPNSLTWGPDGWLYGWNGVFNPSKVASKNGSTYEFTCAIFRIEPRTRVFELFCEGTSNPWGIAIDPEGSFFSSACVIDHLWHLVETGYYIRQGGPYPAHTWPIGSIVDHQHQKAAYCGIHYFDSPSYPPEYRGRLYMGNIHGNCLNVDELRRNGSTYIAEPRPDFLKANDTWFMPVCQKTGPDGSLYVLDWYDRYHCYQDANRDPAGIDRLKGRLYRVRYKETPRRTGFDLARNSDRELIEALSSPNVYDREIAQRLLAERSSPELHESLERAALDEDRPRSTRLQALFARVSSGPLEVNFLAKLLAHPDPAFRAWGVRAAGNRHGVEIAITRKVAQLARDPAPDVRLQVAIATTKLKGLDASEILMEVLSASGDDPLIPKIVWRNLQSSIVERPSEFLARASKAGNVQGLSALIERSIDPLIAHAASDPDLIRKSFELLRELERAGQHANFTTRLLRRLQESIVQGGIRVEDLAQLRRSIAPILDRLELEYSTPGAKLEGGLLKAAWKDRGWLDLAQAIVIRPEKSPLATLLGDLRTPQADDIRLRAFRSILHGAPDRALLVSAEVLDSDGQGDNFKVAVVEALGNCSDPRVAGVLLDRYPRLSAGVQSSAVAVLTERAEWTKALLAAFDRKVIAPSTLTVAQIRRLQQGRDPTMVAEVKKIWGTVREERNPSREQIVRQMKSMILNNPGDPVAGREVFRKLCAQCHRIYGEGQDVGPDITSNGRTSFEQLLSNIFDPSLVIGPGYQATTVATVDGRVLTGLLAEESPERITLKLQGGKSETIPRQSVEEMKKGELSLMPEDVEKQLTPREILDLMSFLCLDRPPDDPSAKSLAGSGPIANRSLRRVAPTPVKPR